MNAQTQKINYNIRNILKPIERMLIVEIVIMKVIIQHDANCCKCFEIYAKVMNIIWSSAHKGCPKDVVSTRKL
jgi:ethanolamine transporter EutH